MTLVKEAISAVIDENGNFNFEKDKLTYFKEIKTYSIDTFVYTDNGTISNEARKKLLISLNKVFFKTLEMHKSKKQKNIF